MALAGICSCNSGIPAIHGRKKSRIHAAFECSREKSPAYAALASGTGTGCGVG
jgi:hypothetical protein